MSSRLRAKDLIIKRAREAGLTSDSGQALHLLLKQPADTVIVNGSECEPLGRAKRELLANYPQKIVHGLRLAMEATGARTGIVAIDEDCDDTARQILAAIGQDGYLRFLVKLFRVPRRYPSGDELPLVHAITGRVIPSGGTAKEVSVLLLDAHCLWSLHEAITGRSVTHQLVTVLGEVHRPFTAWVPRGIMISALVAAAGGPKKPEPPALIVGSVLRGKSVLPSAALPATSSLLLVLPAKHRLVQQHATTFEVNRKRILAACEGCEQCTCLCPQYLMGQCITPHRSMRAIALGLTDLATEIAGAALCSGCGLCSAVACPVQLDPAQLMFAVGQQLLQAGYRPALITTAVKAEWPARQVMLSRLLQRLDLLRYEINPPLIGSLTSDRVVLTLETTPRLKATPVIRDGHRVKAGQRIADVPLDSAGVPLNASLTGTVRLLAAGLEIRAS